MAVSFFSYHFFGFRGVSSFKYTFGFCASIVLLADFCRFYVELKKYLKLPIRCRDGRFQMLLSSFRGVKRAS